MAIDYCLAVYSPLRGESFNWLKMVLGTSNDWPLIWFWVPPLVTVLLRWHMDYFLQLFSYHLLNLRKVSRIATMYLGHVLIAAVLTKTKPWKQSKCPSMEEWIKKMGWIYTMMYYPTIKNKITLSGKLGELEICMLSKQHEPDSERQVCLLSAVWNLQKKKNESSSVFGKRKMRRRGRKGGQMWGIKANQSILSPYTKMSMKPTICRNNIH